MRRIVGIFTLSALAGCQTQPSAISGVEVTPPVLPYQLTYEDAVAIEASVRSSLRDPASAIFGQVKGVVDGKGTKTVCGAVNGRNGFGGYTGFAPYIGMLADNVYGKRVFAVISIGATPSDHSSTAILMMCRAHGVWL